MEERSRTSANIHTPWYLRTLLLKPKPREEEHEEGKPEDEDTAAHGGLTPGLAKSRYVVQRDFPMCALAKFAGLLRYWFLLGEVIDVVHLQYRS